MLKYFLLTKGFSLPALGMIGGLSIVLLFCDKVQVELWVNAHNSALLDIFFRYFTFFGNGIVALLLTLLFALLNIRRGIILLLSYLLSGIIVQLLKNFIFPGVMRPIELVGPACALHLVEGVKIWTQQSFPSGHACTAFAIFFCLSAFTKKTWLQLLAFLLAVLVAYSRMYLSQHFLPDVIAGAVIGVITALMVIAWIDGRNVFKKLDRSVFSLIQGHAKQSN